MALTLLHSDAFTGANGTNLDGRTMTDGVGVFTKVGGTWEIDANGGRETTGSTGGGDQWLYDSVMSDVDIQKCEFKTLTALDVGPNTRFSATKNGYLAYLHFSTSALTIYRWDTGAATSIGSGGTASANDIVGLESSGSNHTAYLNGSSVATASDATHATGKAAIYSGGLGNQHFDDFADYTDTGSTTNARLVNKGLVGSGLVGRGRLVG